MSETVSAKSHNMEGRLCRKLIAALATLSAIASTAMAHDLFIVPEQFRVASGQAITIGFHSGDAFPESGQAPARLRDGLLHGADGVVEIGDIHKDGKRSVGTVSAPRPGHYFATIVSSANTISMEPGEFLDYLKEERLTEVIEARAKSGESDKPARERYTKYAKSILLAGSSSSDEYKNALGLAIEIVPEKDPYSLHPGQSLPVRVLVRGLPAAGLELQTARSGAAGSTSSSNGKTDRDGRISIPLPAAGRYRLHSLHMERATDGAADWESLWATLTFEIQ